MSMHRTAVSGAGVFGLLSTVNRVHPSPTVRRRTEREDNAEMIVIVLNGPRTAARSDTAGLDFGTVAMGAKLTQGLARSQVNGLRKMLDQESDPVEDMDPVIDLGAVHPSPKRRQARPDVRVVSSPAWSRVRRKSEFSKPV